MKFIKSVIVPVVLYTSLLGMLAIFDFRMYALYIVFIFIISYIFAISLPTILIQTIVYCTVITLSLAWILQENESYLESILYTIQEIRSVAYFYEVTAILLGGFLKLYVLKQKKNRE